MMKFGTTLLRTALVAGGLLTAGVGAASAGEWRIDASRCPDLREDRYDRMPDNGWRDGREDRRDEHVFSCPARAWFYVRGPEDSRFDPIPPRPTSVIAYVDRRYHRGYYYRNYRGAIVSLNVHFG